MLLRNWVWLGNPLKKSSEPPWGALLAEKVLFTRVGPFAPEGTSVAIPPPLEAVLPVITFSMMRGSESFTMPIPPPLVSTAFPVMTLPRIVGVPALNMEMPPPPTPFPATLLETVLLMIWAVDAPRIRIPPPPLPPLQLVRLLFVIVFPCTTG